MDSRRNPGADFRRNIIILRVAVWGFVALVAVVAISGLSQRSSCPIERHWPTTLKTIVSAQEYFRHEGLSGEGLHQYWREDIAGLYALTPDRRPATRENMPVRLIELSTAAADDRPRTDIEKYTSRLPKAGYWFRAIRHANEKSLSPDRFAVACFPYSYPNPGKYTFVVDERKDIYRADLGHGNGIDVFPTDEELKAQWTKLD